MNAKYLLSFLSGFISCTVLAAHNPLITSVAMGFNNYNAPPNQNIIISDYIFDSLTHSKQRIKPAYAFSVQKSWELKQKFFNSISLGPAVYYQQARFHGDVYELNNPEFYNYTYQLSANTFNVMLEGTLYLQPVAALIFPFATVGIGIANSQLRYNDFALPGITPETSLSVQHTTNRCAGSLGIGFSTPLSTHFDALARYVYTQSGAAHSSLNQQLIRPIALTLNNHAFYFGLSFRN